MKKFRILPTPRFLTYVVHSLLDAVEVDDAEEKVGPDVARDVG